jgi:hypothetical protein
MDARKAPHHVRRAPDEVKAAQLSYNETKDRDDALLERSAAIVLPMLDKPKTLKELSFECKPHSMTRFLVEDTLIWLELQGKLIKVVDKKGKRRWATIPMETT